MSTLKYLIIIFILIATLIATVFLALRVTIFGSKAAITPASPIAEANSYLFASPLQAKADNKEKIRLTVFILDGRGLGLPNKFVSINKPALLELTEIQSTTNDSGQAVFDITSPTSGTYIISSQVEGRTLPQKVRVMFY